MRKLIIDHDTFDSDSDIDIEEPHYSADKILCDLIKELGGTDIVELYESISKYYT